MKIVMIQLATDICTPKLLEFKKILRKFCGNPTVTNNCCEPFLHFFIYYQRLSAWASLQK